MKILKETDNIQIKNSIVTLGKFDGNHIGHQRLFETAVSLKKPENTVIIFTFNVPPATVLKGDEQDAVRTILTHDERQLESYPEGVDLVIEFPFNEKTRSMSPEEFVEEILIRKLDVKKIVVGKDFCFGKNRSGNVETLKRLGIEKGFDVYPVEKVRCSLKDCDGLQEVSSSLIKKEILKGNLEDVSKMLGRPFSMTSEVVHGKHLGRKLGFPTINFLVPEDKIMPPNGVYAVRVHLDGKDLPAICNVGVRPTFDDGTARTVETNIFDFNQDLYGRTLRIDFYQFIRPEKKFDSPEELSAEVARNIDQVREFFNL
ncbi:MAG: bifunctional riboflavin kinase/FAD synthetase [Parasporobacterium sp.]|nr:bifunctional riboflavin kinase/FAD synthetase [Parasporobacterium sp.]